MKKSDRIVQAFREGKSRKAVARKFGVPIAEVDRALKACIRPGGRTAMKESTKLKAAFARLEKKYPAAAKELAREFTAAIGVASAKAKIEAERQDQTHTITVEGIGRDGKVYLAEFDAIFPKGTKIMGITSK